MKKHYYFIKLNLIVIGIISLFSIANANGTYETVVFIGDDLKQGSIYQNVRYKNSSKKSIFFGNNYNKDMLNYIRPNSYKWVKE